MSIDNESLELLLEHTSRNVAHKPETLRKVMESKVLVPVSVTPGEPSPEVHILHWVSTEGLSVVPTFTSLEKTSVMEGEVDRLVWIPVEELFQLTLGAVVCINPTWEEELEVYPEEVEGLLDGSLFESTRKFTITADTDFIVGQPLLNPNSLVDALTMFFALFDDVESAYLGQCFSPEHYDEPHLLVGIKSKHGIDHILQDVGLILSELSDLPAPVDFFQVGKGELFDEYFQDKISPFYEGGWGRKLRYCTEVGTA